MKEIINGSSHGGHIGSEVAILGHARGIRTVVGVEGSPSVGEHARSKTESY